MKNNKIKKNKMSNPKNKEKIDYFLPKKTSNKKTLVLDLDETLVHSQFMPFDKPSDITLKIEIENEIHDIYILVRPGVKKFLENMAKMFEIVIFTASVSSYADPLLDIIDKDRNCKYRLFRDHCTQINGFFVKELNKLGRDLKDVIIVDNSPLSYFLNPENGIPISSWFDDKNDLELLNISVILEFLSFVPDVRNFIDKIVINDQISYEKFINILDNFNEISTKNKNKNKNCNLPNVKKITKKNNSKKFNEQLINENKENITNNNIILKNNNINKNYTFTNNNINIKIRQNYLKYSKIKQIKLSQIDNKNNSKNCKKIEIIENKENITPNLNSNYLDVNTFFTTPTYDIINQTTKNKNVKNISFNSSSIITNISNPITSNMNSSINLMLKKGTNKNSLFSNKNININTKNKNTEIIKHKKSDSVNLLRPNKKIYENKLLNINKSNFLIQKSNNFILNQKKKIINNSNKYNFTNFQNHTHNNKNKSHKQDIQISMRNYSDLNYELDKLEQNDISHKRLSKSLNKDKLCKNCINNKSTILKTSKTKDNSIKIFHKKNKSLFDLSLSLSKDDSKLFYKKNAKNKLKFKHRRFLSTSDSYNNNNLCKNKIQINNNNNNHSTIITSNYIHKSNISQKKINNLKNLKLIDRNKTCSTNLCCLAKEKNNQKKIPFILKNKRYSANENKLRNKIPYNKNNLIININNNKIIRYNRIQNITNENTMSYTFRPKSLKQMTYGRINTSNSNNNYKEGKRNFNDISIKKSFRGKIINYENNILKKKDVFLSKSLKQSICM